MKRGDFIKKIIALFGVAVLPKGLIVSYKKIYLLQCFVRGFRFYEGPGLLQEMKTGDLLEMRREPNNEHDNCAIALHFNGHKIGFIPAEENGMLSRLMDADLVELLAEITHLETNAAAWENVHIAVYVLRKEEELPAEATYLTSLETPHYHTLKHNNDRISRFSVKGKEILTGEDFYKELVENSKTGEVYSLIHNDMGSAEKMEAIVDQSLLVVNRKKLPSDLSADELIHTLDEGIVELDNAFDETGYVVARINRVAELSPRIKNFLPVKDKKGEVFWEVVFGK